MDEDVKELIGGLAEEMRRGFAKMDARFEEMDGRFEKMDGRFEEMDGRFEKMDGRFEKIDARFEEMDGRFEKIDARFEKMDARFENIDARFDKTDAKIDEKFEEAKRHFGVVADGLRSHMQTVAESVDVVDRKIDRVDERLSGEVAEIKAMIPISFTQLDGRIRSLETDNADLQSRVERLESTAH
ncbi:MAG: hypothetical protein QOI24_3330 [Acidobacteriota bacterium]|nr:hypothetical protein [Acidobacteriota bacterium]